MKKNLSDYLVALSVIACSVVLLAALTIALSGFRLKKPSRNFTPRALARMGERVKLDVAELGGRIEPGRSFDFVEEVAAVLSEAPRQAGSPLRFITAPVKNAVPGLPGSHQPEQGPGRL